MYRLFALLCSLALGIAFSQLPEFAQQYRQRLAGAIDELAGMVSQFDRDARGAGLTRDEALAHYRKAADAFLEKRGRDMANSIARLDRLRAQRQELVDAVGFARLIPVVKGLDTELARRTLGDFEPAVPMTQEGLGLGAIGLVLGRLVAPLLGLLVGRRPGRRRETAPAETGDVDPGAAI